MRSVLALLLVCATACGDDGAVVVDAAPDAQTDTVLAKLQALQGVTVTEVPRVRAPQGARVFKLMFTQPIDHDIPAGPTFQQEVTLVHVGFSAPMVLSTTGYEDYQHDSPTELQYMLTGNQISVEHRFFGESRPADPDWSKLTIAQMAADEHAIAILLKALYAAPWFSEGASKGGMTAVYHHRFYPDDVVGTIAYVAPLSFAIPDHRYDAFLDDVGTPECRAAVRAFATDLLQNRRAAMLDHAMAAGGTYTRIAIGPALESAVRDFEWTYWQYYGIAECPNVPTGAESDDAAFLYLNDISPVTFSDDAETAAFEAYFYQAYDQLGSPGLASVRGDAAPAYLAPYVQYTEADYAGTLPLGVPQPTYDPAAMTDIDTWVQTHGERLVFIYGEWDPWSGGAFRLGAAVDSRSFTVASGTHGADISQLEFPDQNLIYTSLQHWNHEIPVTMLPREAPAARKNRALALRDHLIR